MLFIHSPVRGSLGLSYNIDAVSRAAVNVDVQQLSLAGLSGEPP